MVADAADPVVAGTLIEQYRPDTLVLNAGVPPLMRPVQHQTWQTFSRNWDVDVARLPLDTRGAAAPAPPWEHRRDDVERSGGGGLNAQRRLCRGQGHDPVHHELRRGRVRPRGPGYPLHLAPAEADTGHRTGATAVAAYARRDSVDVDAYLARSGPGLSPEDVGKATVDLVVSGEYAPGAYLLTSAGLSPVG